MTSLNDTLCLSRGERAMATGDPGEGEREGDHVVVSVVESLKKLLPPVSERTETQGASGTIHKVAHFLRNHDEHLYEPKLVSIGPYHRKQPHLWEMRALKLKYLSDLINRHSQNSLEKYAEIVRPHADKASKQYPVDPYDNLEEFIEMLVVDGCFILELFLKWFLYDRDYHENIPPTKQSLLRNDLLLMENQIPFFILESLFQVSHLSGFKSHGDNSSITVARLALSYFTGDRIGWRFPTTSTGQQYHHLLHLYHSLLDPSTHRNSRPIHTTQFLAPVLPIWVLTILGWIKKIIVFPFSLLHTIFAVVFYGWMIREVLGVSGAKPHPQWPSTGIPNASYLRDIGFKFKRKVAASSFLDVTHTGKTINIPALSITERTVTRFRNLLALEHCSSTYGNQFTTFAMFMDYLIDTSEDVAILKESGIIEHQLGDDYHAADFFNNLCRGVNLGHGQNHYLVPLFNYVNDYHRRHYYKVKFSQWRKVIIPDYLTTPLAIAGILVTLILGVPTLLQTFYAIYPYYRPRS